MAVLKILRCKNCTSPLPEGTTTCPKCHAVNLVQSEVNPLHIPMGMTNDYEVAIEEGATMVRVGTGIFGERNYNK